MAVYEDAYILESVKKGVSYLVAKATFDKLAIEGLWENYKRIIKPNGAIVLFGSEPFSSHLRMSNIGWFKYDWVWEKSQTTGFLNAWRMPLKATECVSVFYENKPVYKPILRDKEKHNIRPITPSTKLSDCYGKRDLNTHRCPPDKSMPKTLIRFNNEQKVKHPTQKPLKLMEYLILTYTNKGDLVLDNTAGSGTTGVAAQNLERQWIMIEMDEEDKYIGIIEDRMNMGRQGRMFL